MPASTRQPMFLGPRAYCSTSKGCKFSAASNYFEVVEFCLHHGATAHSLPCNLFTSILEIMTEFWALPIIRVPLEILISTLYLVFTHRFMKYVETRLLPLQKSHKSSVLSTSCHRISHYMYMKYMPFSVGLCRWIRPMHSLVKETTSKLRNRNYRMLPAYKNLNFFSFQTPGRNIRDHIRLFQDKLWENLNLVYIDNFNSGWYSMENLSH